MIKHMRASIEGLLNQSTRMLGKLLEMPGGEARKQLKTKLKAGEKYIPCSDCDGFDPVHGCPGHPTVKGKEITIKAGMAFRNYHMPMHGFKVLQVDLGSNTLTVQAHQMVARKWHGLKPTGTWSIPNGHSRKENITYPRNPNSIT